MFTNPCIPVAKRFFPFEQAGAVTRVLQRLETLYSIR